MGLQYFGQYQTWDTESSLLAAPGQAGDVAFCLDTRLRYMYNGSSWFPTDATRIIRGTNTVNLMQNNTATKILTLPPTSFRFVVLGIHTEIQTLTGTVVTQPTLSAGATPSAYTDIAASQVLNGTLLGLGLTSPNALTIANARAALAGSTDVYVKTATLGAAVGPSAYTARFDLFGYFEV